MRHNISQLNTKTQLNCGRRSPLLGKYRKSAQSSSSSRVRNVSFVCTREISCAMDSRRCVVRAVQLAISNVESGRPVSCVATERQNSYGTLAELCGTDAKHPRSSREAEPFANVAALLRNFCGAVAEAETFRRNSRKTTTEQKLSRNDCREECRVGPLAASRRVFLNTHLDVSYRQRLGNTKNPNFVTFTADCVVERRRQFGKKQFLPEVASRHHQPQFRLRRHHEDTATKRQPSELECSGPRNGLTVNAARRRHLRRTGMFGALLFRLAPRIEPRSERNHNQTPRDSLCCRCKKIHRGWLCVSSSGRNTVRGGDVFASVGWVFSILGGPKTNQVKYYPPAKILETRFLIFRSCCVVHQLCPESAKREVR